ADSNPVQPDEPVGSLAPLRDLTAVAPTGRPSSSSIPHADRRPLGRSWRWRLRVTTKGTLPSRSRLSNGDERGKRTITWPPERVPWQRYNVPVRPEPTDVIIPEEEAPCADTPSPR